MKIFRYQLEELESYLHTLLSSNGTMTSGDVISAIESQYQPFLLVASRLHIVHEQIQQLKGQYINIRRSIGQPTFDIFNHQHTTQRSKQFYQSIILSCPYVSDSNTNSESHVGPSPFAASIAQATAALTAMATAGRWDNLSFIYCQGNGLIGQFGVTGSNVGGVGMRSGLGLSGIAQMGGASMVNSGMGLGTGIGIGGGLNTAATNTGPLTVAGSNKPFQLKPPPIGKRKT